MDTRDSGRSDEQYEGMLDRVDAVLSAFTDSDQFDDLTRYQKQEASFVIESVAELLYDHDTVGCDSMEIFVAPGWRIPPRTYSRPYQETLSEIMPDGAEDHPCVSHYEP